MYLFIVNDLVKCFVTLKFGLGTFSDVNFFMQKLQLFFAVLICIYGAAIQV